MTRKKTQNKDVIPEFIKGIASGKEFNICAFDS
jgi:hypothetical protein